MLPDADCNMAVIFADPTPTAVASPEFALTVALVGLAEDQVTVLVRSAVLESE
jgi:hypothetical protein